MYFGIEKSSEGISPDKDQTKEQLSMLYGQVTLVN